MSFLTVFILASIYEQTMNETFFVVTLYTIHGLSDIFLYAFTRFQRQSDRYALRCTRSQENSCFSHARSFENQPCTCSLDTFSSPSLSYSCFACSFRSSAFRSRSPTFCITSLIFALSSSLRVMSSFFAASSIAWLIPSSSVIPSATIVSFTAPTSASASELPISSAISPVVTSSSESVLRRARYMPLQRRSVQLCPTDQTVRQRPL